MHVTSYTARHSFATHLMRHGAPMLYISKQLGHSNMKTTAAYLENFEDRQIKKWQSKVTDFDL
ncbi:MAG: site-specific integrase [Bacteroidales bacterium]